MDDDSLQKSEVDTSHSEPTVQKYQETDKQSVFERKFRSLMLVNLLLVVFPFCIGLVTYFVTNEADPGGLIFLLFIPAAIVGVAILISDIFISLWWYYKYRPHGKYLYYSLAALIIPVIFFGSTIYVSVMDAVQNNRANKVLSFEQTRSLIEACSVEELSEYQTDNIENLSSLVLTKPISGEGADLYRNFQRSSFRDVAKIAYANYNRCNGIDVYFDSYSDIGLNSIKSEKAKAYISSCRFLAVFYTSESDAENLYEAPIGAQHGSNMKYDTSSDGRPAVLYVGPDALEGVSESTDASQGVCGDIPILRYTWSHN